jgi:transcription initiation factor IIE alpha subunit
MKDTDMIQALNWLSKMPDEKHLRAGLVLRFLSTREVVSDEEMARFLAHLDQVLTNLRLLTLIEAGWLSCKCVGDEPEYWLTTTGKLEAERCIEEDGK